MTFDQVILCLKSLTTSKHSYTKEQHHVNVLRPLHGLTLHTSPGSNHTQNTTLHLTISSHTCLLSVPDHTIWTPLTGPQQMVPYPLPDMLSTLITPHHSSDLREGSHDLCLRPVFFIINLHNAIHLFFITITLVYN